MPDNWVDFIFEGDQSGYVYVALSDKKRFKQLFIKWPQERDRLLALSRNKKKGDLYFCPALFSTPSGKAKDVLGSWVVWADVDHATVGNEYPAGLVVASGSPGKTHRYWRSKEFLSPTDLVLRNYFITKELKADPSGIDPCQLLRVPDTLNHKTTPAKPVEIKFFEEIYSDIPPGTRTATAPKEFELLPIEEVLISRQLPRVARELYVKGSQDRSTGLMRLAFELSEHGFKPNEVYTLLHSADTRWGKFSERDDKELRLSEIVQRSELSYTIHVDEESAYRKRMSWGSVGNTTHTINWIYEGLLRSKGSTSFIGFPGAGKSQAAINLAACAALEIPFAGHAFQGGEQKIFYSSTEMDDMDVNYILQHMGRVLSPEQLEILDNRVDFYPVGHSLPLDLVEIQEEYEALLEEDNYTGLIIDSVSSSISESLNDEKQVRRLIDWVDHARQKYGIWVVLLSHVRKPPAASKQYAITLNDMYGSQIIAQRTNSAVALTKLPNNLVEFRYIKGRQKNIDDSQLILKRSPDLWYSVSNATTAQPAKATVGQRSTHREGPEVLFELSTDI